MRGCFNLHASWSNLENLPRVLWILTVLSLIIRFHSDVCTYACTHYSHVHMLVVLTLARAS